MIYFARRRDNYIKIGWTELNRPSTPGALTTPDRDHAAARKCLCGSERGAGRLTLMAVMSGTQATERRLHARFDDARVEDEHEWFQPIKSLKAFIDTLNPIREFERKESCVAWLQRVGTPEALHNIREHRRLQNTREAGDGWPLWQICAGMKHGRWLEMERRYVVHSRGVAFLFHVFVEACRRQGLQPKDIPIGAIKAGTSPRGSHRGVWSDGGRKLREEKAAERSIARVTPANEEQLHLMNFELSRPTGT